jgi:hypothetical protein
LLSEAATFFLDLNRLLYKNLSEQLTLKQIEAYFATQSRWQWLQYVLLPVVLYLKSTVLAWILAIGGFFYGLEISHKNYWKIVLQAEFIFLVSVLVKILWFVIIQPEFSLEEVQQFVPFSLQSILDTTTIPSWALYPLQLLNVFEGLYWVLLVVLLNQASGSKKGALIVVSSYGPALFIWIIFIMFLTLNLN